MLIKVLVMLFALMSAPVCLSDLVSTQIRENSEQRATRYACAMHPEAASTKRGMTPRLAKNGAAANPVSASSTAGPAAANTGHIPSLRIPDTAVYDQNGERLRFYTDLIKGKTVAINFIFTTCTTICPPLTAIFRKVQQDLGQRIGLEVRLISVSVDPATDTPERLHDFAAKFKAGPGWAFVTGDKAEIDSLLQALGAAVGEKNNHTPVILVGNDTTGYWTRTYGLSSPATLVRVITEAANHK